ncbi:ptpla domain protein [Anaeramoeba flamelloides]|uniref:very-long-chain (3R)-3-hydroxyacyl-CoA dehydratase n=1 Tax=Anaeramoeba flamelloides TaxID=1746091 RepID=A0AAV7ZH26_9EUKA|nr:ptpla domain protein [Anaeramoeba flamelloides]
MISFSDMDNMNPNNFYEGLFPMLQIFQTPAILEIIHAIIGIVPNSPLTVFSQVFSRVFMVWGICKFSSYSQASYWFLIMSEMWSMSEVVRYLYYTLKLICNKVDWIPFGWSRYSFFFVLYPIGVFSELIQIYNTQPQIKENKIFTTKYYNFSIICYVLMVIWIPSFVYLYVYMIKQRMKFKRKHKEQKLENSAMSKKEK